MASNDDHDLITHLHPSDVVLGRGAGPNEHSGNIAFREIVHQLKPEYIRTVNRKMKCQIADKVVRAVKARNGRFLKRAPGRKDEVFVLAEEDIVMEKAKQALRHGRCTVNPRKGGRRISYTGSLASVSSAASSNGAASLVLHSSSSSSKQSSASPAAADLKPLVSPNASPAPAKTPVAAVAAALAFPSQQQPSLGNPTIVALLNSSDEKSYETCLQMLLALAEAKRSDTAECLKLCTLIETLIAAKRAAKEQQQQREREQLLQALLCPKRAVPTALPPPTALKVQDVAQTLLSGLPKAVVANDYKNSVVTSPLSSPPSSPSVTGLSANTLNSSKLSQFLLAPKPAK